MKRLLAPLLCAAGCAAGGHDLGDTLHAPPTVGERARRVPDSDAEGRYQDQLRRYSQRQELYAPLANGVDTRLFCATTFQAPSFREARVERQAIYQALTRAERDKLLAQEQADAQKYDDFMFGVQAVDYHFDDFDRPNSIWNIALVGEGVEEKPASVERLGRASLDKRAYYPYLDDFWVAYRIRFPKLTQGRGSGLVLRLASTLGKVELRVPSE